MHEDEIDLFETRPNPDEIRMGVAKVEVLHWGRTTFVKFRGDDGFETIGAYTAGPRNNVVDARVAIARANAIRRLCMWRERRQEAHA